MSELPATFLIPAPGERGYPMEKKVQLIYIGKRISQSDGSFRSAFVESTNLEEVHLYSSGKYIVGATYQGTRIDDEDVRLTAKLHENQFQLTDEQLKTWAIKEKIDLDLRAQAIAHKKAFDNPVRHEAIKMLEEDLSLVDSYDVEAYVRALLNDILRDRRARMQREMNEQIKRANARNNRKKK